MNGTAPPPPTGPPVLRPLVDCTVCDGRGVMTARAATSLAGPSTVVACPVCDGTGAFVQVVPTVGSLL